VFVIVAVNTEVLPVGSVGRIIQVISIFVVDRQEMPRVFIELPPAFGADQAMYLEGAFPIITLRRRGFLQLLKRLINGLIVSCLLRQSLMMNSVRFVFHVRNLLTLPLSPAVGREGGRGDENVTEKPEPGLRNVLTRQMKAPQHPFDRQTPP
jgi:hypothetical protein